jgi:cytochrome oxidase Cu insertion factor (SCO1/SenC/PrrC family)
MTPPRALPPRPVAWLAAAVAAAALGGCTGSGQPDSATWPPTTGQAGGRPATSLTATSAPATAAPERPRRPEREAAPDLRVTAFDGRTVTLGAFRGRPAVVNFFESW